MGNTITYSPQSKTVANEVLNDFSKSQSRVTPPNFDAILSSAKEPVTPGMKSVIKKVLNNPQFKKLHNDEETLLVCGFIEYHTEFNLTPRLVSPRHFHIYSQIRRD